MTEENVKLEAEEEYPVLDSPLGRMLFALGVEVVNCGVAKDADRLRKVHDVYNSLQALWPENVKEIHDTVHKRMAEEGLAATETGEIVKVEKTGEPVKIQKVVKRGGGNGNLSGGGSGNLSGSGETQVKK